MRGATLVLRKCLRRWRHFNPRAPCGARPFLFFAKWKKNEFQSTRPMRGATACVAALGMRITDFNPRAPCGARLAGGLQHHDSGNFNPRAPCGARLHFRKRFKRLHNFNPRAPCGARQNKPLRTGLFTKFQSTRPMRGATNDKRILKILISISIHAPHAGRDLNLESKTQLIDGNFNPRAPCGARRLKVKMQPIRKVISIHAPHAGRDRRWSACGCCC